MKMMVQGLVCHRLDDQYEDLRDPGQASEAK